MTASTSQKDDMSQIDKFKKTARELECDDDEERFKERLKKIAKQRPGDKPKDT